MKIRRVTTIDLTRPRNRRFNMFLVLVLSVVIVTSRCQVQQQSLCMKLQGFYETICLNQPEGDHDVVAQGPPGKRGIPGDRGEKGSLGLPGLVGEPGVVDYNRVQEMVLRQMQQDFLKVGTVSNPASSCQEVKSNNASANDGLYYLRDFEGHVFQTYCSMNTAGGGWTLVASIHENNMKGRCTTGDRWSSEQGNSADHPHGDGFWENRATHGEATSATSDDYKNSGYFAMNASDIMIWVVPNDCPMESFSTRAFFKFHTINGFLMSYGGNLKSLYSDHFPMRSKQFRTNADNGPAIPIVWDAGSNQELVRLVTAKVQGIVDAGFVQFRTINHERNAFALCPGLKIKSGKVDVEHACIGSTSYNIGHANEERYCGDFAARDWPQWSSDQKLIDSVVMMFYK